MLPYFICLFSAESSWWVSEWTRSSLFDLYFLLATGTTWSDLKNKNGNATNSKFLGARANHGNLASSWLVQWIITVLEFHDMHLFLSSAYLVIKALFTLYNELLRIARNFLGTRENTINWGFWKSAILDFFFASSQ